MTLYLLRHTRVDVPQGICYGQSDVPLAESFPEEAAAVVKKLSEIRFDRVYSSPLSRCMLLAEKISNAILEDDRLKELNFGDWEGKTWDSIYESEEGKHWFADYENIACPQGESFRMMIDRVSHFIGDLPPDMENLLIVTHAGIIRSFLTILKGFSIDKAFNTPVDYGEISIISQ